MEKKATLKLIVCLGENGLIGDSKPKGNGLLWHSKEELTHYRETTRGNVVLFGKNTAAVVPIEIMKKTRDVIVLERDTDINKILINYGKENKTVFICGGLEIYRFFLENYKIDELLISKLKNHIPVEKANSPVYFPDVDRYGYKLKEKIEYEDFILEKYTK